MGIKYIRLNVSSIVYQSTVMFTLNWTSCCIVFVIWVKIIIHNNSACHSCRVYTRHKKKNSCRICLSRTINFHILISNKDVLCVVWLENGCAWSCIIVFISLFEFHVMCKIYCVEKDANTFLKTSTNYTSTSMSQVKFVSQDVLTSALFLLKITSNKFKHYC